MRDDRKNSDYFDEYLARQFARISEKEENVIVTKFEVVCMKIFGQDSIIKKKWE